MLTRSIRTEEMERMVTEQQMQDQQMQKQQVQEHLTAHLSSDNLRGDYI